MNTQNNNEAQVRRPNSAADSSRSQERSTQQAPKVVTPAQYARLVLGITAPFGHDGLPTVLG